MTKANARNAETRRAPVKISASPIAANDGTALIAIDPWLKPFAQQLRDRYAHYQSVRAKIDETGGMLGPISQGHHYFGFNRGEAGGQSRRLVSRMGAGGAQLRLIGDFNNWDRGAIPMVAR